MIYYKPKRNSIRLAGLLVFVVIFSFGLINSAEAASLSFSPSSTSGNVGDTVNVSVLVNTNSVAINNTEATINFPSSLLQVVSVSTSGSIFPMWIENPTFSNNSGTISFNGGVPNPGFTGSTGKVVVITFRVKKQGTASLSFTSASILANDGLGTEVFQSSGKASLQLNQAVPVPSKNVITPDTKTNTVVPTVKPSVKVSDNSDGSSNNFTLASLSSSIEKTNNLIQSSPLFSVNQLSLIILGILVVVGLVLLILLIEFFVFYYNRKKLSKLEGIEKEIQNLRSVNNSREKELSKIKDNINIKLDKKTDLLKGTIQQLRADNTLREKELLLIKENLEWKLDERTNSFEKTIQQLRADNSTDGSSKKELLQSLFQLQTNVNNELNLFKSNIEQLKTADATNGSEILGLKEKLETQLQAITDSFRNDIQQLKEASTAKEKVFSETKQTLADKNILFEKELQRLKEVNASKEIEIQAKLDDLATKQELPLLKEEMTKEVGEKLKEISRSFDADVQQIKKINATKDGEFTKLRERLDKITLLLDEIPEQQKVANEKNVKEQELLKVKQEMLANLQQIKKANVSKDSELKKLKEKLNSLTVLLGKIPKQQKTSNENNVKEKELLKLKEELQTKLEEKIASLKKEIKPLEKTDDLEKELSKLETELGKRIKDGLSQNVALLGKEISKFKEADSDKQKRLSSLEDKLPELKKLGIIGKEKLAKLEDSIKKTGNDYRKLDTEEQALRAQVDKINRSLKAFYAKALLD
ncbi:MAG: cohesin domain-containing protein [Candidatus Vogelbacteria bacterium]|nr:cohesin domain-containing protein [Candidatus Vogelbacteria bacterium]